MKKNDNNLFYTCSLIELIGRTARQTRKDVVNLMGEKIISHIYHHADTLHCEPIAGIADYYIDFCHIPTGNFDNVASCKYLVPSYWDIGKVYARLIEDIRKDDVIAALFYVYNSAVSDSISYYNSDFFYQPRDFIKEQFLSEENAETGKASKKPAIRFRGFTDAWEQRKLCDAVDVRSGCDYQKLSEGSIPVYGTGGYMLSVNKALSYSEDAVGIGRKGTIDKPYILRAPFWTVDTLFYAVPRPQYDLQFLFGIFQKVDWKKKDESTGVPSLSKQTINTVEITVPKNPEQQKIGQYFKSLDRLITLHQRKYDKLVKIKKSMLEKLFPKNDSKFPEIRFSGFTDAWEQRKLGDEAIEIVAGGDIDKSLLDKQGQYPVIANALTDDGIVGYYASDYRIKAPAVTVTGRGDVGHAKARIVNFTPIVRLLSVRSKHDVFFLENVINTIHVVIESTGVPQLTVPQLSQYELFFPKTILEEEKIGQLFRSLDRLLTLHQRKLEKLKKIKKSCLEKMFA